MGYEQSKAAKRRFNLGQFHSRYFVGRGIDVGGKPDPLAQYCNVFPLMKEVKTWDVEHGDGQYLEGIDDNSFDFLHSSHTLEHIDNVEIAISNWIRVVKPKGFLIVTVPDEDLFEQGHWPSQFNKDHKWTFTIFKHTSWSPKSINLLELFIKFSKQVIVEKVELQRDIFRDWLIGNDQSLSPVAECGIEFILKKL